MSATSSRILLVIGGGIAAYKALELIRRLRERDVGVRVVMTAAAAKFITPLSAAALSGDKVYQDLFSLTDEAEMGHIELSREADLVVVAPHHQRRPCARVQVCRRHRQILRYILHWQRPAVV